MSRDQQESEAAGRQAAEWIVRLSDECVTPATHIRFEQWLAERPENAAAYKSAELAWTQMGALGPDPGSLGRFSQSQASQSVTKRHGSVGWRYPVALSAGIAACLAFVTAWVGDPIVYLRADFRTQIAQNGSFRLEDGSHVDLGPSSAIAVRFDNAARRVELLSGSAYFRAVPKARAGNRPFIVDAENGASQALGTRFQVERTPGGVVVTVMEHQVAVAASNASTPIRQYVISPGQRVKYGRDGQFGAIEPANADLALAWRSGQLVFDRAPLSDVIAVLNRYRAGRILIVGKALAAQRVSGVFERNDIDGAIDALASEVGATRISAPLLTALY
ncbi:FecR family protein [Novosphingobium sp. BL-52-GroH]|uniref:FecR family protein n=1 Tax=Novosphingobium sp. BL-52-GroH TaxID=3349877 RepID=UPI00384BDE2C